MRQTVATFALMALVGMLVFTTACGGNSVPELRKVEKQDVLVFLRSDSSPKLDPQATSDGGDAIVLVQMYEGLVSASKAAPVTWEPALASKWEISADARTYTFTIRSDVKFHDGAKLDSSAVRRSFERLTLENDPATPGSRPYADDIFGCIARVETPDSQTIRFTLKESNTAFLANCGMFAAFIVSPKAIEEMEKQSKPDDRIAWLNHHPAGTGPYTIAADSDYQSAENITLTAFSNHWRGKAPIGRLVFQTQSDGRTRLERLKHNDVQVIDNVMPADWQAVRDEKGLVLFAWDDLNVAYLAMNMDTAKGFPTADKRVREAIALAVDRAPMIKAYDGIAQEMHVLLPTAMPGHPKGFLPACDAVPREDALKRARALIKEAGFEGRELVLAFPEKPRPYLLQPERIADLLRQQFDAIGLKIKLEKTPNRELFDSPPNSTYPLVLIGWMTDNGDSDNFWRPLLAGSETKPSDNNFARFFDKGVYAEVFAAAREAGMDKRALMYEALERRVHNEFRPIVPLLSSKRSVAWRAELEGLYVDSLGFLHAGLATYR